MKTLLSRLTLLFVISIFFPFGLAQDSHALIEESARRWVCLNAEHTGGHKATLTSGSPAPLPNAETYIFVCIGNDCTTGDSARDIEAIGKDGMAALAPLGFNFEGMTPPANPLTTDASGGIGTVVWGDSTPQGHSRIWMALNKFIPGEDATGQAGGQQQGTFTFELASKDCARIAWDPYGRVFDAQTLEPIFDARVTLFTKRKDGTFTRVTTADVPGGAIVNPYRAYDKTIKSFLSGTDVDGVYNFVVEPGEYKLEVEGGMITDESKINPNYKRAYYDVYPAVADKETGVIVEKEKAEHRDIAVPTRNTRTEPKIFEERHVQSQGVISFSGRISHPLGKAVVLIKKVYTDGRTEYRDGPAFDAKNEPPAEIGMYSGQFNQADLEVTDEYVEMIAGVYPIKQDLTLAQEPAPFWATIIARIKSLFSLGEARAQVNRNVVPIQPMPSYLEGYAYDAAGQTIPKALVSIYLSGGTKPYYQTYADEAGFYKIGSEFIPPFQYDLRYQTALGQVITVSTEKYLIQNKEHLLSNSVDPFQYKPENKIVVITPTPGPGESGGANINGNTNTGTGGSKGGRNSDGSNSGGVTGGITAALSQPGGQGIIMIVVAILVLVLIGVGAFVMMKSKQQQPPQF